MMKTVLLLFIYIICDLLSINIIPNNIFVVGVGVGELLHEDILLFNYHKTGYYLLHRVIFPTLAQNNTVVDLNVSKHFGGKTVEHSQLYDSNLTISAATAPLCYKWESLINDNPNMRIVHFIREPYEWILSHYKYHKRGSEYYWTSKTYADGFCDISKYKDNKELKLSYSFITAFHRDCTMLMGKFSFYHALTHFNTNDGLRVAAMNLFRSNILSAGINQLQFNRLSKDITLSLFTSEFVGSVNMSNNAMNRISKLVYNTGTTDNANKKQLRMTEMLIHNLDENINSKLSKDHMTLHDPMTTKEEELELMAMNNLKIDPVLSPILNRIKVIFEQPSLSVQIEKNINLEESIILNKTIYDNEKRLLFVAGAEGTGHHIVAMLMRECSVLDEHMCSTSFGTENNIRTLTLILLLEILLILF